VSAILGSSSVDVSPCNSKSSERSGMNSQPVANDLGSSRYETTPTQDRFDRAYLLQRFVGKNRRVLELGCSTGYISRLLKQLGCSVVGIELDAAAAQLAAGICDQVFIADLNGITWSQQIEGQFDVVLMGDVLEHLVHPDQVLRSARQFLLPGGDVVVSLPNVVHWSQRIKTLFGHFNYQLTGLLDYTHLRFFTACSARALIENSGYRIVDFHPIIGGHLSSRFRFLWQVLANVRPTLFAYQLLFRAQPVDQLKQP